jgi:hypothetical protein
MSGGREGAASWLAKTATRSCLHPAHWDREARNLPLSNRADTWVEAGRRGGGCAAECVATGAARRRRGEHVALNVVCRGGMRVEAEGSCRQCCWRARWHHHLGGARRRRTPTPPGTRAWPPRRGAPEAARSKTAKQNKTKQNKTKRHLQQHAARAPPRPASAPPLRQTASV